MTPDQEKYMADVREVADKLRTLIGDLPPMLRSSVNGLQATIYKQELGRIVTNIEWLLEKKGK